MPPIIAFTGPAGAGKDTAAAFAVASILGYRYGLADPIREMLRVGLGIDMSTSYWIERKEAPIPAYGNKSPRQLMQWLGTEWGRYLVDRDLWVTRAKEVLFANGPGMVISDLRFENEAAWVRSMGGLVVHLSRPGIPVVHAHASEDGVQVAPGDLQIVNDGSLEQLQAQVREACQ